MNTTVQKIVDNWYDSYCKTFGQAPTWEELTEKIKEVKETLNK